MKPVKQAKMANSVVEFCEAHGISVATFYVLAKRGDGPIVMKVGRRSLISVEAAENWRRRMEGRHGPAARAEVPHVLVGQG